MTLKNLSSTIAEQAYQPIHALHVSPHSLIMHATLQATQTNGYKNIANQSPSTTIMKSLTRPIDLTREGRTRKPLLSLSVLCPY